MTCLTNSAWPGIIFIVVLIITLVGIAFGQNNINQKVWTFVIILIAGIIWLIIIYWYCVLGYHVIGWFLLILPLLIYISWKLSMLLAKATTPENCVAGDKSFNLMWLI